MTVRDVVLSRSFWLKPGNAGRRRAGWVRVRHAKASLAALSLLALVATA